MTAMTETSKARRNTKTRKTRRADVIRATWRVIVRDGLAQASMRSIAYELGCSTGVLTHHFRNKDDMVTVAINEVARAIGGRMARAVQASQGHNSMETVAKTLLPIDPEGEQLWAVWIHFLSEALINEKAMENHVRHYDQLRKAFSLQFKELQKAHIISSKADIAFEVDYIIAVLDGLGIHSFISPKRYAHDALMKFVSIHMARVIAAHAPPVKAAS